MGKKEEVVFLLETIYVDDKQDVRLVQRELRNFLSKIHPNNRRLFVYLCTEEVKPFGGK